MTPATRQALAGRSGGVCEAQLPICAGRATDAQHRKAKKHGGRKGKPIDDLSNLAHLCRPCHRWAHDYPTAAREMYGLVVLDWENPAEKPMRVRGSWRLLDDVGGYSDDPPGVVIASAG